MTTQFFGEWTDDEKAQILLQQDEIQRNIYNPTLRMTDKEHHEFMVNHFF